MATIKDGTNTLALAAFDTAAVLQPHKIGRPEPAANDVQIDIKYCGMCHSDLHACNGDWYFNIYPIVPGHEIAGIVVAVGTNVTTFQVGDRVGVGTFINTCFDCNECYCSKEQYCSKLIQTYGSMYTKGLGHDECAQYHTNGGYSSSITVRSNFVYHVPKNIDLSYVGPLLCSGVTMYSPLNRHVLQEKNDATQKHVGIIGFGGVGQMGIKLAVAMGAKVTVFSRSTSKQDQATKLGATLVSHTDDNAMNLLGNTLDVILDTVAVEHDVAKFLPLLKVSSTLVCIGGVIENVNVNAVTLLFRNLKIEGSFVGGIEETQQMLDFCSKHNILPEIKVIHAKDASAQFKKLGSGDADIYRAVIDMSTLPELFTTI